MLSTLTFVPSRLIQLVGEAVVSTTTALQQAIDQLVSSDSQSAMEAMLEDAASFRLGALASLQEQLDTLVDSELRALSAITAVVEGSGSGSVTVG